MKPSELTLEMEIYANIVALQALRFYLDPLSEIVVRMGVNNRREALEQLFGNADIDESVIQIVLSYDQFYSLLFNAFHFYFVPVFNKRFK